MSKANKKMSFEEMMAELERLVAALEEGGMPLDESIAAYERATGLSAELEKILNESEKKILALTSSGEVPFEAEELA